MRRGRRAASGLLSRLSAKPRAVVLLYHRVAEPVLDPWALAVSPKHFAEHMAVLRREATVVALRSLPDVLAGPGAPRRCVAVTFDDGYADNLAAAAPVLARHDVPATVFVTAGAIGGAEFWWDRLTRLLLDPATIPERLDLEIGGERLAWSLGSDHPGHRTWRAGTPPPTPRHAVYLDLWRRLQGLPADDQQGVLDELAAWTGVSGKADGRALRNDELAELAGHPLVEIGAHTVSHPRLAALGCDRQREEVVEGRRRLEALTRRQVSLFAYPYGRPGDFDDRTVGMVRDAGFGLACANVGGTVRPSTDRHLMPRAYVRDCDGRAFAAQLRRWLRAPAG